MHDSIRCWCCQNLLTSGDTNGVCRACRENTYNENKYKKMWEKLGSTCGHRNVRMIGDYMPLSILMREIFEEIEKEHAK